MFQALLKTKGENGKSCLPKPQWTIGFCSEFVCLVLDQKEHLLFHLNLTHMRSLFLFLLLPFLLPDSHLLAQDKTPILLTGPEDMIFERIDFPLGFAPEIDYQGFEELRFSKGWSKRGSENYFTYIFIFSLEGAPKIKPGQLQQSLEQYYRGLCSAVAGGKDFTVDPERITVQLSKVKGRRGKRKTYHALVLFQDSFNNGEEVALNMEIEVSRDKKKDRSQVLTLVSPRPYTAKRWQELRQIREDLKL